MPTSNAQLGIFSNFPLAPRCIGFQAVVGFGVFCCGWWVVGGGSYSVYYFSAHLLVSSSIVEMRILCLHGSGASGEIMKIQIANLRSLLPSSYEFDFLDSPIECEPATELRGVYPGPYFCFFQRYTQEEMDRAVEYVHEVIEEDGPYDCVMGFSQGASVAAACITKSHKEQIFHLPFKMAVFMCAALIPPEIASEADLVKTIGSFGNIDIPTVHVIGKRDLCYSQSLQLLKSCTVSSAQSVFNGGGHDVPRDAANTTNICVGIERAARLAFSG